MSATPEQIEHELSWIRAAMGGTRRDSNEYDILYGMYAALKWVQSGGTRPMDVVTGKRDFVAHQQKE
jgi:hypothetical protein